MRHTVKVLSYILISSIVTSLVFASDKKTEEELFKNKQIKYTDIYKIINKILSFNLNSEVSNSQIELPQSLLNFCHVE